MDTRKEVRAYGISTSTSLPWEAAVRRTREYLKEEGFGVLTEIDVKKTMKEKLDKDFRNYIILGACNPPFAHKALQTEIEIGLLLPCNVIVYDNDQGGTTVSAIDPEINMQVANNFALEPVACEVKARLEKVIRKIGEAQL